jgi:hypothetical protein
MIATSKSFTPKSKIVLKSLTLLGALIAFAFSICAQAIPVDPTELEKAIQSRRLKVDEFNAIAAEAKKRGLRVFLAGGLAASYGDFIKHQLLAEQGKMEIQPNRLDPVAPNITLPEQDWDLVITRADGTPESVNEIQAFRTWLSKGMPKEYKGKTLWDINGLKTAQDNRLAWSGDPEFARQNNDSLSIGLIELTEPPAGTSVIQEADHIAKPSHETSLFLKDLAGDEVHFLASSHHVKTSRAIAGTNPEIFGAVRILTKAFQFDKELPKDDLIQVAKIIRAFDPNQITTDSYADTWLKTRAKRLVTHSYAPDVTNTILDHLGLKEKLIQLGRRSWDPETISWWMNKTPLSTSAPAEIKNPLPPVTAGELGITHVDHVTHPEAARLMTWRYDGLPRVFISRENTPGETAVHGSGFYTNLIGNRSFGTGSEGAVIQLSVDPKAREGIDFRRIGEKKDGLLWLNGTHLRAIHPQYNPTGGCKDIAERLAVTLAIPAQGSRLSRLKLIDLGNDIISWSVLAGVTAGTLYVPYAIHRSSVRDKTFEQFIHGTPAEQTTAFETLREVKVADRLYPVQIGQLVTIATSDSKSKAMRSIEILGATSKEGYGATGALIDILGTPNPNLNSKDLEALQVAVIKALVGRTFDRSNIKALETEILLQENSSLTPYFLNVANMLQGEDQKRLLKVLSHVQEKLNQKAATRRPEEHQ